MIKEDLISEVHVSEHANYEFWVIPNTPYVLTQFADGMIYLDKDFREFTNSFNPVTGSINNQPETEFEFSASISKRCIMILNKVKDDYAIVYLDDDMRIMMIQNMTDAFETTINAIERDGVWDLEDDYHQFEVK